MEVATNPDKNCPFCSAKIVAREIPYRKYTCGTVYGEILGMIPHRTNECRKQEAKWNEIRKTSF